MAYKQHASKDLLQLKISTLACLAAITVAACASHHQPPLPVWQAWSKVGSTGESVKTDMLSCGYTKDLSFGFDLPNERIPVLHRCMEGKGYRFDTSSYLASNCYGRAPYPCRAYWDGGQPKTVDVRPAKTVPN